jgi:ubiquinone/menaquinone biosynthesis C-methylase UbiE
MHLKTQLLNISKKMRINNMADYNKIGINYNKTRKADFRIFNKIFELADYPNNKNIIDIGAGTGNYANLLAEKGNRIVALEPSSEMMNQATENENVEWIKGIAEDIKYGNNVFDIAICILSIHHFSDLKKSFNEIFRVLKQRGILLIYTHLPEELNFFWLQDYFPALFKVDTEKFPSADLLKELLKDCGFVINDVQKYELHYDLRDNFLAANWRKPKNYLKEEIRSGISTFSLLSKKEIEQGVDSLRDDLSSGEWNKKYGAIKTRAYFDAGYRFFKLIKN